MFQKGPESLAAWKLYKLIICLAKAKFEMWILKYFGQAEKTEAIVILNKNYQNADGRLHIQSSIWVFRTVWLQYDFYVLNGYDLFIKTFF